MSVENNPFTPANYGVGSSVIEAYLPGIRSADTDRLVELSTILDEADSRHVEIDPVLRLDYAAMWPSYIRREYPPLVKHENIDDAAEVMAATRLRQEGVGFLPNAIRVTTTFHRIRRDMIRQAEGQRLDRRLNDLAINVAATAMTSRFTDNPKLAVPGIVAPTPELEEVLRSRHKAIDPQLRGRRIHHNFHPNDRHAHIPMVNSLLVSVVRYAIKERKDKNKQDPATP